MIFVIMPLRRGGGAVYCPGRQEGGIHLLPSCPPRTNVRVSLLFLFFGLLSLCFPSIPGWQEPHAFPYFVSHTIPIPRGSIVAVSALQCVWMSRSRFISRDINLANACCGLASPLPPIRPPSGSLPDFRCRTPCWGWFGWFWWAPLFPSLRATDLPFFSKR